MNHWKLLALLVLLVTVAAVWPMPDKHKPEVLHHPTDARSIEGVYLCEGSETPGKSYTGAATIRRYQESYVVQWIVQGTAQKGIGVRLGDQLAVGWQIGDKVMGVTLYRISKTGLTGRWATFPGDFKVKDETLTFLRSLPPPAGE